MTETPAYRTKTGKPGVVCECGRRALLTPDGRIYRHSPIIGKGWCPQGGTRLELCCEYGPPGHTEQQHHDASACFDTTCHFDHPHGGPFPHPCDNDASKVQS